MGLEKLNDKKEKINRLGDYYGEIRSIFSMKNINLFKVFELLDLIYEENKIRFEIEVYPYVMSQLIRLKAHRKKIKVTSETAAFLNKLNQKFDIVRLFEGIDLEIDMVSEDIISFLKSISIDKLCLVIGDINTEAEVELLIRNIDLTLSKKLYVNLDKDSSVDVVVNFIEFATYLRIEDIRELNVLLEQISQLELNRLVTLEISRDYQEIADAKAVYGNDSLLVVEEPIDIDIVMDFDMRNIETLYIEGKIVNASCLNKVGKFEKLSLLHLDIISGEDFSIDEINTSNLVNINLAGNFNGIIGFLEKNPTLREVHFETKITGEELDDELLMDIVNRGLVDEVKRLELSGGYISDEGLKYILKHSSVEILELYGNDISLEEVSDAEISNSSLRELHLMGNFVLPERVKICKQNIGGETEVVFGNQKTF